MAFDERLADRVRTVLADQSGLTERQMFGGIGFMLHGNVCSGVIGEDLIVRVGPDAYDAALRRPGAREFDFTGRPMTGWVFVEGTKLRTARALSPWVARGVTFARSLPRK